MTEEAWHRMWTMLEDRFNRETGADLEVFYLDELEERLTDEEIERAVQRIMYENTYFPSPQELVEAGRHTPGEGPEEEWQRVLLLAQAQRNKEPYPEDEHPRPTPAALRALASIGGIGAINKASEPYVIRFREAFLEAYEAFEEDYATSLPAGTGPRSLTPTEENL